MVKEFWINLPVKDTAKSKAFFTKLGFSFNEQQSNDTMLCMLVGQKGIYVNMFVESMFKGFTQNPLIDPSKGTEVLFSIDAESREEVDALAKKAADAGGIVFGKPSDVQGWMYGCGFTDLDGHRWNVLYMDMSKLPK